jgi:osmoprotectant transport system permease protein
MWHFLHEVIHWYAKNWSNAGGYGSIPALAWDTVDVALLAVAMVGAVFLPIALFLGHIGRGGFLAINITNIGRAVPTIAVLVIGVEAFGLGSGPIVAALVVLSIPPIVTNTYAAVRQVDPNLIDAARGMGMTGWQILWRVEVPSALPLIAGGIRTATVQAVATVSLAAIVAYTCLGSLIYVGLSSVNGHVEIFAGALLVVALAALTELVLAGVQRLVTPAGVRLAQRRAALSEM